MISEVETLIKEGNAALLAGDTFEARRCFRRVLEHHPDHVEALIGLAGAVQPYREKREYLQQALSLDPTNEEAQASLDYVEAKLAVGEILAPRGVKIIEPTRWEQVQSNPKQEMETLSSPMTDGEYCYIHPTRETGLRCTNCNRLICHECVRPAPVGQLCPECARARRPRNYKVSGGTLVMVAIITILISFGLSFFIRYLPLGFLTFFLAFFLAPPLAELIIRFLDRLTHAKRGREMQIVVSVGLGLGAALSMIVWSVSLSLLLFTVLMITTAIARLR